MPWINNAPLQDLFKDSVDRCSQQMLRKSNNRFVVSIAPGTLTISCRVKNWMQLPFPAYSLKPIIDGNYLISTLSHSNLGLALLISKGPPQACSQFGTPIQDAPISGRPFFSIRGSSGGCVFGFSLFDPLLPICYNIFGHLLAPV